jgi:hypothetical protein
LDKTLPQFPSPAATGKPPAAGSKPGSKPGTKAIPLTPPPGPPEQAWNEFFRNNKPSFKDVRETVLGLHEARRHEEVIALINAAILQGQSQPWMYDVLALSMQIAGRPAQEVERVLLSGVDVLAVNVQNMLYSAAYLARFDMHARALQLYRQASSLAPLRPEPYALGLKLAREAGDAAAIEWAASGILSRVWGANYEQLHREAEDAVAETDAALRKAGQTREAEHLRAAIAEARQRDLVVELTWSGKSDLDLIVEEPLGSLCSFENPRTPGGGILVHDGYGPDQKNTYERYLCPKGFVGDYRVRVKHVWGEVVGKRATLRITRYRGTPHEAVETRVIELGSSDKIFRLTLNRGRLTEALPTTAEPETSARGRRHHPTVAQLIRSSPADENAVRAQLRNNQAQQTFNALTTNVGYQPVISVLSEGVTSSVQALVSADRRYVRLTLSPTISTITDVLTFSFATATSSSTP